MSDKHDTSALRFQRRRPRHRHGGLTIIVVLGIISITMAMTYAVMRNQGVMLQVQLNSSSQSQARQAAMTGLTIALRKMHESSWTGVDSSISADLTATDRYKVTYSTGDPTLSSDDADYDLYPYRVTLTSVGYSEAVDGDTSESSHTIKAVVQLVPRALASEPSTWTTMQNYTMVQWANESVTMEVPVRCEGNIHAQGEWTSFADYMADSGNYKAFDGLIDEVAIYEDKLGEGDIYNIYWKSLNLGNLTDEYVNYKTPLAWWRLNESSGSTVASDHRGSNNGLYEGAEAGETGITLDDPNGAARFDGFNDHINLGRVDISGHEMSILAWFKADDFGVSDARLVSKATSSATSDHYWMLSTIGVLGNTRLRFRLKTVDEGTTTLTASSGNLSAGQWYFAGATFDGQKMKLFLNGALVGEKELDDGDDIETNSNVFVFIGNNPPGSPRARYLRDLQAMYAAAEADHRPMTSTMEIPFSRTSEEIRSLFSDDLQLTVSDTTALNITPLTHPGTVSDYKLYPGGKQYSVESLSSYLTSTSKVPNVLTNPLGIFYRSGAIDVYNDVSIEGTVISNGNGSSHDLEIHGTGVTFQPVNLLPLEGTSDPIQLPVALVAKDFRVLDGASVSMEGQLVVWDDCEYSKGYTSTASSLQGKLFARGFKFNGRYEWDQSESWYRGRLSSFLNQLADGGSSVETRFPVWLKDNDSLDSEPTFTIKPTASSVTYHWPDFDSTIYVAHPDDAGLRWDLIRWIDGE